MLMPLALTFTPLPWGARSLEPPFAQPLGRDPLFARDHWRAAVQGPGGGMGALVAEEDGVAALGRHVQVHVGKAGSASFFRFGKVHDQRGDTLPPALEDRRRARL